MNALFTQTELTRADRYSRALAETQALTHLCESCDAPHAAVPSFCERCDDVTEGYVVADDDYDDPDAAFWAEADFRYELERDL